MAAVTIEHFRRAAVDIGAHGDNDTLPFDVDTAFVKDNSGALSALAFDFYSRVERGDKKSAIAAIAELPVFSERLLVPTGSAGFRIATKVNPFWGVYFNGISVGIAERLEPARSERTHAYRFLSSGMGLFDRGRSWRSFREASILDVNSVDADAVVVQTDIASFYEHAYHHRIQNAIDDLFPDAPTMSVQVDRLLSKFSAGRSFGLPVGGQGSRVIAELLLASVDKVLTDADLMWRRYVDDFVIVASNQSTAYRALALLANTLADYGLSLNRSKTTILRARHYADSVRLQLDGPGDEAAKLKAIDLHFDPYSDTADADYELLKDTVGTLNVWQLLDIELRKGQPDAFTISQIGRTLRLHEPVLALQLCRTILNPNSIHALRASWSTIMRGVSAVASDPAFLSIRGSLDELVDNVPQHSPHLLHAESSLLHYLRTVRTRSTPKRAAFVAQVSAATHSDTVRRACIDCWRHWKDRARFTAARNRWTSMGPEEQRMLWLAAGDFGDEGTHSRSQLRRSARTAWNLGFENNATSTFADLYMKWADGESCATTRE